uniref:S8/S53 family peptidase n=1 Tax=uncultured Roseobacter sp. TaxID=114847 RepID=UPI00262DF7E7
SGIDDGTPGYADPGGLDLTNEEARALLSGLNNGQSPEVTDLARLQNADLIQVNDEGKWSFVPENFTADHRFNIFKAALVAGRFSQNQRSGLLEKIGITQKNQTSINTNIGNNDGHLDALDLPRITAILDQLDDIPGTPPLFAAPQPQTIPTGEDIPPVTVRTATNPRGLLLSLRPATVEQLSNIIQPAPPFNLEKTSEIKGHVFDDANGNNILDVNEETYQGQRIFIDENANGEFDNSEASVFTDSDGFYSFGDRVSGAHQIGIDDPDFVGKDITHKRFDGSGERVDDIPEVPEVSPDPATRRAVQFYDLSPFQIDGKALTGTGTRIYVLDGPVDNAHEHFIGADIESPDFNLPDDPNTEIPNDEFDLMQHGTAVASVITGGPSAEIQPIAPGAKVISLSSPHVGDEGFGKFLSALAAAAEFAKQNPDVPVIVNISFTRDRVLNPHLTNNLFTVLKELEEAGVIVVTSAGNQGQIENVPRDLTLRFPNVIIVTSEDGEALARNPRLDGKIHDIAIFYPNIVTVADPSFLRTVADFLPENSDENYRDDTGTSYSSPAVAAVLSLGQQYAIRQHGRKLRPEEMQSVINKSGVLKYNVGSSENPAGFYRVVSIERLIKAIDALLSKDNVLVTDNQSELQGGTHINFVRDLGKPKPETPAKSPEKRPVGISEAASDPVAKRQSLDDNLERIIDMDPDNAVRGGVSDAFASTGFGYFETNDIDIGSASVAIAALLIGGSFPALTFRNTQTETSKHARGDTDILAQLTQSGAVQINPETGAFSLVPSNFTQSESRQIDAFISTLDSFTAAEKKEARSILLKNILRET